MALENDEILFEFTGLEPAIGNVQITFFHKGDDSVSGTYSLKVGSFTVGDSQTGELMECTDYVVSPTTDPVPDDDFNDLHLNGGGDLKVSMAYDDNGSPNSCTDGQMAYVNLRYQYR